MNDTAGLQVCPGSNNSVRRNYLPLSHRRDGLIEFMQDMLMHSFVLNNPESYFRKLLSSPVIMHDACCVLCFFQCGHHACRHCPPSL